MVAAPSIAPSDAPRRGRGGRRRLTPQRALFFALFLGAPLLLYILFVVWAVLQAIFYSLTNWRGLAATPEFIGLDNYVRLFNDGIFRQALVNNLILLIVLPTVVITLAFVLAVLVRSEEHTSELQSRGHLVCR